MIRDDLPYEQIAARMFPEKCATGGAIKERFAKLRIECLNRGSWVPPIIGKTPQGTRPNVRGVVRLAPGMDRGRFILWKEDASRLIDPKDIMKGYNDAQAQGLEFPQRRWIAESSKEEFYRLKKEMEARGLMPEGAIPVDDAEEEEEGDTLMDDADEDDEDDDENAVLDDVVFTTPANRKGKGRAIGTPASRKRQGTTPHPTSTPAKRQSTGRTTRTMTPAIKQEFMGTPTPGPVVTPKTARGRGRPPKNKVAVAAPVGPPKRLVLIMRGVAPAFLYRFPNGVSGVGATEYYEDEVKLMMLKNAKVEVTQVADHSALEVAPGLNSSQLNAGGAAPVANPNAFGGGNVLVGMQDGGFGPDDDDASVPVVLPGNLPAIHPSLFMRFPENIQNALLNNTVSDLIWEEGSNEFWRHDVLIQHAIANFDEVTGVIRDQNMFAHQMKILQQGFEQYNIPLGNGLAEGGGQFDDNFTLGSPNQAYRAAGGGRAMDDGDISPRNTYGGQSFDMNDYIQDGGSQASGSGRN